MAPALVQVAALALRASTTICPTSPTCPQDDKCFFSANGASLEVNCATDYYGGDLQLARTSTLARCMRACSSTSGCVAVSYVGENCYMKSTLNSAQANNGVIGAYVITRETNPVTPQPTHPTQSACPASYTCPENDGCTFTGADTRTFSLSCGVDFYGGDLTSLYAASLASCTQACSDDVQCIAASFVGGTGAGQCYLKNKNNGKTFNQNVDGISLIVPVTPSSSTTPSPTPSTTSSATTASIIPTASTSTLISGSITYSLASELPSQISSVATTVSSQTGIGLISSSVSQTPTSVVSESPDPTPIVVTPNQIVANPSFELGDGSDPTDWTIERLYIIDAGASGRFQVNPRTGSSSIRGRGMPNGGYDVYLTQTVTVVPGARYNIEVFAKQTTNGYCSVSIYLGDRAIREFAPPGISYTSITALVDIPAGDPVQQALLIDGACSLPDGNPERYDLFIDDVTMTLVS